MKKNSFRTITAGLVAGVTLTAFSATSLAGTKTYNVNFDELTGQCEASSSSAVVLKNTNWTMTNHVKFWKVNDAGHTVALGEVGRSSFGGAQWVAFGVTSDEDFDITKGPVTASFDMKIASTNNVTYYSVVEPYSYVDGMEEYEMVAATINTSNLTHSNPIQYGGLSIPSSTLINNNAGGKDYVAMRNVAGQAEVRNSQNMLHNNYNGFGKKLSTRGAWFNVKFVIDYTTGDFPKLETYINNELMGTNTVDLRGANATNLFHGIRFLVYESAATSTSVENHIFADNFSFSQETAPEYEVADKGVIKKDGKVKGAFYQVVISELPSTDLTLTNEIDSYRINDFGGITIDSDVELTYAIFGEDYSGYDVDTLPDISALTSGTTEYQLK